MHTSQNAAFHGTVSPDIEYEHPPGALLARTLEHVLHEKDWEPQPFDNWRDVGWSIICARAGEKLQVALAKSAGDEWFLQVAPEQSPGFLGRLFRGVPSASSASCYSLARDIHNFLVSFGTFSEIRWRWDGPPDQESSKEPEPAHSAG